MSIDEVKAFNKLPIEIQSLPGVSVHKRIHEYSEDGLYDVNYNRSNFEGCRVGPGGEVDLKISIANREKAAITKLVIEFGLFIEGFISFPIPNSGRFVYSHPKMIRACKNDTDIEFVDAYIPNAWNNLEHPGRDFGAVPTGVYIEYENGRKLFYEIDRTKPVGLLGDVNIPSSFIDVYEGYYPAASLWVVPGCLVDRTSNDLAKSSYLGAGSCPDGSWDVECGIYNPTDKVIVGVDYVFSVNETYDTNSRTYIPEVMVSFKQPINPRKNAILHQKNAIHNVGHPIKTILKRVDITFEDGTKASYPKDYRTPNAGNGQGCYVATAVYGSYDCAEVWTLRRFRDYYLDKTWYGKKFIKLYYAVSPTLVKLFGSYQWFNKGWKSVLNMFVRNLNEKGYDNTPYND